MEIRQATIEQKEVVVKLFGKYRQFYQQQLDVEAESAFIQQRLEQGDSIIYLAFIHDEPAGFAQLYPTFSSVSMKRSFILNDLYVDEALRKQGVAQALIERCYALCEEHHARYLTLETASDNKNAQQLYEKMGMSHNNKFWTYQKTWG